ncbi:unnamed protein product, partial [Ectocarpus sp. 6 AP-2014]
MPQPQGCLRSPRRTPGGPRPSSRIQYKVPQCRCCRHVPRHTTRCESGHACPTQPLRMRGGGICSGQQPAWDVYVDFPVNGLVVSARRAEPQGRQLQLLGRRVPTLPVARLAQSHDDGVQ